MNSNKRRVLALVTMSSLTLLAFTGFRWQLTKYLKARKRWGDINQELAKDTPSDLKFDTPHIYPYKYVQIRGKLTSNYTLVKRSKDGRLGYLVFRGVDLMGVQIAVLDGWVPDHFEVQKKESQERLHKGLLKLEENKDYLNQKLNKGGAEDREEFNTFVNLTKITRELGLESTDMNRSYYIELFEDKEDKRLFPARYNKNDFQKPYLTPERHLNYSIFWGSSTLVGIWGILKAWKR